MKKRLRSRVLAVGMVSSTLLGAGGLLYTHSSLLAQDKPTATELLERGAKLLEQKQFIDAKKVLLDIDPAQLPEDQRGKLTALLKSTDEGLAKALGSSAVFDAAQANLDSDKLVDATKGFQAVLADASAPADLKEKAKIQLALTKEKQAAKADQMKALLKEADTLYASGKYDEAENALNTIDAVGADLGWQDNATPAALRKKIAEKRVELAKANSTPATPATPAVSTTDVTSTTTTTTTTTAVAATPTTPSTPAVSVTDVTAAPTKAAPTVTAPAPAGSDFLTETIQADAIQQQRALELYNNSMKLSKSEMDKQNYPAAIENARQASIIVDANRQFFSEAQATSLRNAAQAQLSMATDKKVVWDGQQTAAAAEEAARLDKQRAARRIEDRNRRVNDLMRDAQKFVEVQQYKEAADTLRLVIEIDKTNSTARLMLSLITDKIYYRSYDQLTQKQTAETVRQMIDNKEHLIPYADLLVYPEDWIELTRTRVGDQGNQDTPANRAVRERLDENLKDISAENQAFEKVVNFLRENTNTNIFVNWKALEGAGIDRNTQVSVNLREVPFKKVLTTILSEVGGGTANLGYTIDDGVITISTRDDLNSAKYQTVRVFDIRDMLVQPDNAVQPPSFNLSDITKGGTTTGGSGGGGGSGTGAGSLFTDSSGGGSNSGGARPRAEIVTEIVDTIKATVAPESWRDTGGTIGSIRELNGQLIVNQTIDNQLAVHNLLAQLRETRALMIAIEARLLLVSNNFLDDFGLGWNVTIPAGTIGANVGALSFGNNSANMALPPSTGVPGNLSGSMGGTPANSSLSIAGSIIDNWQLDILMRATQADKRTVTVTAPRVTLFNGQRGYIAVTNQQNFVSNFNQTVANGGINGSGSTGTNLTVSTLTTGVVLYVEATVSSDRRYVIMKLRPQLSNLEGIDTFSTGVGNVGGNAGNNNGGGGNNNNNSSNNNNNNAAFAGGAFVQLPRISYTTVDTMVSVPDGGTLLIGGQKLVGEAEIEVGVPVLSKIPGINRLFTNRSFTKDERTLLILVKPKILIQKEEETRLFGPGYDRPSGINSGIPMTNGAAGIGANQGLSPAATGSPTLR